jgi:hypothetical protein
MYEDDRPARDAQKMKKSPFSEEQITGIFAG